MHDHVVVLRRGTSPAWRWTKSTRVLLRRTDQVPGPSSAPDSEQRKRLAANAHCDVSLGSWLKLGCEEPRFFIRERKRSVPWLSLSSLFKQRRLGRVLCLPTPLSPDFQFLLWRSPVDYVLAEQPSGADGRTRRKRNRRLLSKQKLRHAYGLVATHCSGWTREERPTLPFLQFNHATKPPSCTSGGSRFDPGKAQIP
jgi:hypothetical protein